MKPFLILGKDKACCDFALSASQENNYRFISLEAKEFASHERDFFTDTLDKAVCLFYLSDAHKLTINESKKLTNKFLDTIKNSPLLQLEFKVFNSIDCKHIENESIATRYIDNNIKLFEIYTIEEIDEERGKLNEFLGEDKTPDNDKVELYEAIDILISESLECPDSVDVDRVHEAFVVVLNHVKKPKNEIINENELIDIDEDIIEIAVDKFNERYSTLNENDKNLLQELIKSDNEKKESIFNEYKENCLKTLNEIDDKETHDSVAKAIKKIDEMSFTPENINESIIDLYELKKELS